MQLPLVASVLSCQWKVVIASSQEAGQIQHALTSPEAADHRVVVEPRGHGLR